MARKRTSAARRGAGIKQRITAKQKSARRKNIAIARQYRKRGAGKLTRKSRLVKAGGDATSSFAKYRGYDKRRFVKTKEDKRRYAHGFKKSYNAKRNIGKPKHIRVAQAHKNALKWATARQTWGSWGLEKSWVVPGRKYRPRKRK
jgi:hypothetical protein